MWEKPEHLEKSHATTVLTEKWPREPPSKTECKRYSSGGKRIFLQMITMIPLWLEVVFSQSVSFWY